MQSYHKLVFTPLSDATFCTREVLFQKIYEFSPVNLSDPAVSSRSERDFYIPRLELCLRDIKTWTMINRLVLNDSKTELVHICSKFFKSPSFPKITIGTSEVDISTAAKNLGVVFDKSLDMKDHVKNFVRAASLAIYWIGRLRRYVP